MKENSHALRLTPYLSSCVVAVGPVQVGRNHCPPARSILACIDRAKRLFSQGG